MGDDDLLFGWDEDRRWVWADDGETWRVDLPGSAAALVARAAARSTTTRAWLKRGAVLEVSDGDASRSFRRREITELLTAAGGALKGLGDETSADDDRLAVLAQGAALLAAVLDALSQPDHVDAPPDAKLSAEVSALTRLCEEFDRASQVRVQPRADGSFRLRWTDQDRSLLAEFTTMFSEILDSNSDIGDAARLFPSAYGGDAERNTEWVAVTRDELTDRRRAALETARELMTRSSCDEEPLLALVQTLNGVRLVLGTRLDVSEDGRPRARRRDAQALECFDYLGRLQYEIIEALRTVLPRQS